MRILYWIFVVDEDYSHFTEKLKKAINSYQIHSTDILAILFGTLGVLVVAFWPEMPGDMLGYLVDYDFNIMAGIRDSLLYLLIVVYLLHNNVGFKVKVRENLSLERYLSSALDFIFSMSRKDAKFDTDKIFETVFYNTIFNTSKKIHDFFYQDLTLQLLWIPVFLSILLLWQQIYRYF